MDLQALERAVASDPKNPEALRALGEALLVSGRPGDALDPLRRALVLDRQGLEAYLLLGRALLDEGEVVAAIATLEGGRELSRAANRADLLPRFEELLAGLGPAKRRSVAPMEEASFDELARATLARIGARVAELRRGVTLSQTPSILVLEAKGRARLGLSVQKSAREIWCSSAAGELRFRHIPSTSRWRAADGEELLATVSAFLSRELGESVSVQ